MLLDNGRWDGAYYLAGYAVECALKACVAKLTALHDFPPPREFVQECYTHDLGRLLRAARLQAQFDADARTDAALLGNWKIAENWDESSRYGRKAPAEARAIYVPSPTPHTGCCRGSSDTGRDGD